MHVGFLTAEYPPVPGGGIGTSLRNLGRALVRLGHRVTVIGWGPEDRFDDQGVDVRFLGHTSVPKAGWLLNRRRAAQALRTLVHEDELAIVEAHDWCGPSAGMRLPCPLVIRCNGTATYFAHLLDTHVRPSVRRTERRALRAADDVVAVSRFTAETTRRLFGLARAVGVVPNGIDPSIFTPADPDEVDDDLVLYFGTLIRKKGVLDLCQAFDAVVATRPRARLELVGRDNPDPDTGAPSTWALCQAALSPAAAARTTWRGPLPYAEMQDTIRRAALCVFPSYAEALPLSWLEAMACAKPVVAYDVGWAPEMIASATNGWLVPAGDTEGLSAAIVDGLGDARRAQAVGRAARATVEQRFSDLEVARQSLDWYQRVIARHAGTGR